LLFLIKDKNFQKLWKKLRHTTTGFEPWPIVVQYGSVSIRRNPIH